MRSDSGAFFVYVLQSAKSGRFYVGSSGDPHARLVEHIAGKVTATRAKGPWRIVYTESFATQLEARRRERHLKSMKSHVYLDKLIAQGGLERPD